LGTVVPNHKELKIGTLKGILELAEINEEEFVIVCSVYFRTFYAEHTV